MLAINALAPFILNARLRPLLEHTVSRQPVPCTVGRPPSSNAAPASPSATTDASPAPGDITTPTFIVNVSAMEGKFYR